MSSAYEKLKTMNGAYESGNNLADVIKYSENGRALRLLKQREKVQEAARKERETIDEDNRRKKFKNIETNYATSHADALEEEFKKSTIGLVSIEEFRQKRKEVDDMIEGLRKSGSDANKKAKVTKTVRKSQLSFGDDADVDDDADDDDDNDEKESAARARKSHFGKCPTAKTDFLPDVEREAEFEGKKQKLTEEYHAQQDVLKGRPLEVTYSYWDGSGHRRNIMIKRGFSIGEFLMKAKGDLEKDFPELRHVAVESLMYIKEDLIIPSGVSFHELIQDKARGKSGPLFNFDVHDDIREYNDVRIEKDESHAGKIVERKWYERNKHIFPASRWEVYDKNKTYDRYTIHGDTDPAKDIK